MSAEPTPEQLRSAPVLPGFELPDSVTLTRGVVLGNGMQPEDVGVLAWLKLRDPRRPATQEELAMEMQAAGWKMGKTRFAGIFQRLKSLGHIRHLSVYNPDTGRPEWRIEFYLNPANNAQYVDSGISSFPQAGGGSLESGDSQTERLFGSPETGVSRGQKESQVSGDSLPDPRKPGIPSGGVPAGQDRNPENPAFGAHPPHPPEGGGNTTPSPHKKGRGNRWALACALAPEDYAPTEDETSAADGFLQDLPGKWQMSIDNARALAPLLASRAHTLGLELDTLLEIELTADDPKDPVRVPSRVMPVRIRNLKRRRESREPRDAGGGLAEWCGECNNGNRPYMPYERTVELADGRDVPCRKCHPKHART